MGAVEGSFHAVMDPNPVAWLDAAARLVVLGIAIALAIPLVVYAFMLVLRPLWAVEMFLAGVWKLVALAALAMYVAHRVWKDELTPTRRTDGSDRIN